MMAGWRNRRVQRCFNAIFNSCLSDVQKCIWIDLFELACAAELTLNRVGLDNDVQLVACYLPLRTWRLVQFLKLFLSKGHQKQRQEEFF